MRHNFRGLRATRVYLKLRGRPRLGDGSEKAFVKCARCGDDTAIQPFDVTPVGKIERRATSVRHPTTRLLDENHARGVIPNLFSVPSLGKLHENVCIGSRHRAVLDLRINAQRFALDTEVGCHRRRETLRRVRLHHRLGEFGFLGIESTADRHLTRFKV